MIIVVSDHCLHLCLSVSKCSSGFSAVICWLVTSSSSCSCLTFPLSWVCSCPCCCSVSFSLEVCRQWYHTGMHELLKELSLLKAKAIKAKIKFPRVIPSHSLNWIIRKNTFGHWPHRCMLTCMSTSPLLLTCADCFLLLVERWVCLLALHLGVWWIEIGILRVKGYFSITTKYNTFWE